MGGFLYCKKQQNPDAAVNLKRSIEVFEKKQLSDGRSLSLNEVIEKDDFVIYLYQKIAVNNENVFLLENGDFILNTGTLIYKNRSGLTALKDLYTHFDPVNFEFSDLQGQFCILLFKNKKLYIWNDLIGIYHVFTNDDQTVISSSFLAVVRQLKSKQIDMQAMYEYVCEGASYNDNSYIQGVKLLDAFNIHELSPKVKLLRKKHSLETITTNDFDERVDLTADSLLSYFNTLKDCFGQHACSALSGGYDSRLILALLSEVKMNPYLYVYGARQSADVRVATMIAEAENLPIFHDSKKTKKLSVEEFQQITECEFFYCDGHGPNGVFSNGAEFAARTVRSNAAELQLNGGGGEIFRNFWKLPDRPISIMAFLQSRFDHLPASTFNKRFDTKNYLLNLHDKIQQMLEIDDRVLTRTQAEKLYVFMRIKYWMGFNTSIQNLRSYALIPLAEPVFAYSSFSIPFKQKELGGFEAALIRRLNPKLAAYDSAYGYNFSSKPTGVTAVKNSLMLNLPVSAQRFLRKFRYACSRLNMPYYLQQDYIDSVVPADDALLNEYFILDNIRNPLMLSRIQTVNLVLSDPF